MYHTPRVWPPILAALALLLVSPAAGEQFVLLGHKTTNTATIGRQPRLCLFHQLLNAASAAVQHLTAGEIRGRAICLYVPIRLLQLGESGI